MHDLGMLPLSPACHFRRAQPQMLCIHIPFLPARHQYAACLLSLSRILMTAGFGAMQGQQGLQTAQPLAPGDPGAGGGDLLPGQAEAEFEV